MQRTGKEMSLAMESINSNNNHTKKLDANKQQTSAKKNTKRRYLPNVYVKFFNCVPYSLLIFLTSLSCFAVCDVKHPLKPIFSVVNTPLRIAADENPNCEHLCQKHRYTLC